MQNYQQHKVFPVPSFCSGGGIPSIFSMEKQTLTALGNGACLSGHPKGALCSFTLSWAHGETSFRHGELISRVGQIWESEGQGAVL